MTLLNYRRCTTHTHTPSFNDSLSGTARVGLYQKKYSSTHAHPVHQKFFINFLRLLQSVASSLFHIRAWQFFSTTPLQVLFDFPLGLGPCTSYSMHFFTQSWSSFRNTCPYRRRCTNKLIYLNLSNVPALVCWCRVEWQCGSGGQRAIKAYAAERSVAAGCTGPTTTAAAGVCQCGEAAGTSQCSKTAAGRRQHGQDEWFRTSHGGCRRGQDEWSGTSEVDG